MAIFDQGYEQSIIDAARQPIDNCPSGPWIYRGITRITDSSKQSGRYSRKSGLMQSFEICSR